MLVQIEEPAADAQRDLPPGLVLGIDLTGPSPQVAASVGANAELIPGFEALSSGEALAEPAAFALELGRRVLASTHRPAGAVLLVVPADFDRHQGLAWMSALHAIDAGFLGAVDAATAAAYAAGIDRGGAGDTVANATAPVLLRTRGQAGELARGAAVLGEARL